MHIVTAGLNHRTAPVEVREQIAFSAPVLPEALLELRARPGMAEAAILSTCNRSELYVVSRRPEAAQRELIGFLGDFHRVPPQQVTPHLYHLVDQDAARHLFRVAAGIDSMVLGEGEILRQVKSALESAAEVGTLRAHLNELFQRSLHIGKRARSETGIHRGTVSVASAAVDLAKNVFGDLRGRSVLVIGAGEMSQQTLTHLVANGVKSVIVANRTHERAVELAAQYQGEAVRFDDFPKRLESADIIVSSSAAPHPIVTVEKLRGALAARRGRPLFIIDIAVPRDVESAVAELPNVYLFDIDDLQQVTEAYRREREKESLRVEALVEDETGKFMTWLTARGATPVIQALRGRADSLCDAELGRWLKKLPDLEDRERQIVEQMMRSFANKLLHAPLTRVRELTADDEREANLELVRRLFELDGGGDAS